MKKIFITLIMVIAIAFSGVAQEKTLTKVGDNKYAYTENTKKDPVHQIGYYKLCEVDNKLKRNGTWKLYVNGKLKTRAVYDDDELKLLVVDGVKYSTKDLYILKLESKVENLVSSNE
jgi:nitrate reductase beta subunit